MYHPYDTQGSYVALFSGFSWNRIIVLGSSNGVWLKLNIPKSCSQADRFV